MAMSLVPNDNSISYNDLKADSQGVSKTDLNVGADFWHYEIGANVIPANSKSKSTIIKWSIFQDNPIPNNQHEEWKNNGSFHNGIAVITGRLYQGVNKGKFLVGVDFYTVTFTLWY